MYNIYYQSIWDSEILKTQSEIANPKSEITNNPG